jgi:hypothetical protein
MPTPMAKQTSSERIRKNPRCKAVKGCRDHALILSWKGKPICARHYGRWKRTGRLGEAGHSIGREPSTRASLNDRCLKNRDRLRTVFGLERFAYMGSGPGRYVMFSSKVPRSPTMAIPAFKALVRRGLVKVDLEGTARVSLA